MLWLLARLMMINDITEQA